MSEAQHPIRIKPEQAIAEAAALGQKIANGAKLFEKIRDEDVADRDHAQGRGLPAGQGDALPLQADRRSRRSRPRC